MSNARPRFPLLRVAEPRIRLLHFTWLAFFITFIIWFAHVSLMPAIASSMQLARPLGGWLSDRVGRRRVLVLCLATQTAGYLLLSDVSAAWSMMLAVAVTLVTSVFVQAACGAVYSIVPLIQRRMTGQIAGMAGAYGNVGGVLFLTVLSFVSPALFFISIAGVSALAFVSACFLDEPRGFMVEVDEKGVTHRIAVE